jgi:hypothetical protein
VEPGGPIPNRQDVDAISGNHKGINYLSGLKLWSCLSSLEIPAGATPLFFDTKHRLDSEDSKRSFLHIWHANEPIIAIGLKNTK